MTGERRSQVPDDAELMSLHRFLNKDDMYDLETSADYDICGTVGWWSNYWQDWDELRAEERYDHWFTKNIRKNTESNPTIL